MTTFSVAHGDVTEVESDLLLLKYARAFYGADAAVAKALVAKRVCSLDDLRPQPDENVLLDTKGAIAARMAMFVGTLPLGDFGYEEMKLFAQHAIAVLHSRGISLETITTTVHGVGYGLDAAESLQSLVSGFHAGLERTGFRLRRITVVSKDERTVRILKQALAQLEANEDRWSTFRQTTQATLGKVRPGAYGERESSEAERPAFEQKPHVFVAMPFAEEFQDVYEFGIFGPVRKCGYICERVDDTSFAGDILQAIRNRIETASLVIAELTGARPNVYLEIRLRVGQGNSGGLCRKGWRAPTF